MNFGKSGLWESQLHHKRGLDDGSLRLLPAINLYLFEDNY